MSKISLSIKDCVICKVQVYPDRAEITREIPAPAVTGEAIKLYITGLVDSLDPNSVRVKGNKFNQILEVSQDRVRMDEASQSNNELLKKRHEYIEIRQSIDEKNAELARVDKALQLAVRFANGAFDRVQQVEAKSLNEAQEIMTWYAEEQATSSVTSQRIKREVVALNKQFEAVRSEIKVLEGGGGTGRYDESSVSKNNYHRTISVSVESQRFEATDEVDTPPPLILTYHVRNASWSPSYDVRIDSIKNKLQLVYFAEVKQQSGEDWTDIDLQLSTANPSIGSSPKPLIQTIVRRKVEDYHQGKDKMKKSISKSKGEQFGMVQRAQFQQQQVMSAPSGVPRRNLVFGGSNEDDNDVDGDYDEEEDDDDDDDDENYAMEAAVSGDTTSRLTTAFNIPRKCTIESDNRAHKVIIATLSFNPDIVHYCAPSTGDISVYLQSKTKNDSSYIILPSTKVAIFLDGAFVSMTSINQTSPNSNFYLYLGTDVSVKCDRKPVKDATSTGGWVSTSSIKDCSFVTLVHNTKSIPITIIIADVLPKAGEEKILVELMEPKPNALKKMEGGHAGAGINAGMSSLSAANIQEGGVFKNDLGNTLLWVHPVKAGEKKKTTFHYKITHPQDMKVEVGA